jgi:hypothetical protein
MRRMLKAPATLACLALALVSAAPAISAQEEPPVSELKEITYQKVDDQLQVFIRIEGPYTFETLEIQAPQRLVLDFRTVSKISAAPIVEVNDVGIASIRTGQFQTDVARVVFDLADKAPAHSLTQVENGLKIVFWMEAAPVEPEKPQPQVKPEEIKPVEQPPVKAAAAGRRDYFIKLGGGLAIPAVPDTTGAKDITLYAENCPITEIYKLSSSWMADLAFGKYITPTIRVGVGATYQSVNVTTAIQGDFPHPFLMNTPTTVDFPEQTLSQSLLHFYAFGLFTLVRTETIELSAGPMLGYARADYGILESFGMTDEVTADSRTVTITDQIFSTDTVSGLSIGAWVSGQYVIGRDLTLVVDARLFYFNPLHGALGLHTNLSGIDVLAGIQYNF